MASVYKVAIFVRDRFLNLIKIKSLCTIPLFNIEIPETFRFEEETRESPPLTSCRIFFSFLDFVTREKRKCLKKKKTVSILPIGN